MICCVFLDLSTTAQYSHLIALIVMFTVAILHFTASYIQASQYHRLMLMKRVLNFLLTNSTPNWRVFLLALIKQNYIKI